MGRMICPQCKGRKAYLAHINYGEGRDHEWKEIPCSRCNGEGTIPDEQAEWIAEGRRLRDARVHGKPYKTLHARAAELGLSVVELSAMENGHVMPYTMRTPEVSG